MSSGAGKTVKKLSAKAIQAAMLEGTGHSLSEICRTLDTTSSSVSRWRRNDLYKEEVEKFQKGHLDAIEPVIRQVKEHLADGAVEAVDALREQLKATVLVVDSDGGTAYATETPDWETRHQAAATLLAHFKVAAGLGQEKKAEGQAAPGAGVTIVVGDIKGVDEAVRPNYDVEGSGSEVDSSRIESTSGRDGGSD